MKNIRIEIILYLFLSIFRYIWINPKRFENHLIHKDALIDSTIYSTSAGRESFKSQILENQ